MEGINAVVASKAYTDVTGNTLDFTQLIEIDGNYYDIYADILSDNNYVIANTELIDNEIVCEVNEKYKRRDNDNINRSSKYEQGTNDVNTKSFEGTTTGGEILEYYKENDNTTNARNEFNRIDKTNAKDIKTWDEMLSLDDEVEGQFV